MQNKWLLVKKHSKKYLKFKKNYLDKYKLTNIVLNFNYLKNWN